MLQINSIKPNERANRILSTYTQKYNVFTTQPSLPAKTGFHAAPQVGKKCIYKYVYGYADTQTKG